MSGKRRVVRTFFALVGSVLLSFGITFSLFSALEYDFLLTLVWILVSWFGYLTAHYGITGSLMHNYDLENIGTWSPLASKKRLAGFLAGILMVSTGFIGGVYFSRSLEIVKSLVSVLGFVAGYMLLHYGTTGTAL